MDRENYYILLGLSFDPPENDITKINAAIANAQQQWSRDSDNPLKRTAATQHLEMLDDIRKVMSNGPSRAKEAAQAKQIRTEQLNALDEKLVIYKVKKDELDSRDIKALLRLFGKYGIDEKTIRQRFASLGGGKKEDVGEVISIDVANNIKNLFRQMGTPGATLYTFLGLNENASPARLTEAAEAIRRKLLSKGTNSATDRAQQDLAGLAKEIFKSSPEKAKYDNYLRITQYGILNDQIDEAARINKRTIDAKMKDAILEVAMGKYAGKLSLSQARAYIDVYCNYMGYTLSDNRILCRICNTENPPGSTVCSHCGKPLFIICPSCGKSIADNIAKICPRCGFDLTKIDFLNTSLAQAKQAILSGDYDTAADLVKKIKMYWPDNPDLPDMEKQIRDFQKFRAALNKITSEIQDAIQEKDYYKARTLISKAKRSGYTVSEDTIQKVSEVISYAERQVSASRGLSPEAAVTCLLQLAGQIHDSPDLKQELSKYPPEPVSYVTVKPAGEGGMVTWNASKSAGRLEYVLVRKEYSVPNGLSDTEIYRGSELRFADSSIKTGVPYYYGVVVLRAGFSSGITLTDKPLVRVAPVTNLRAVGGDSAISLSWHISSGVSDIRVFCYEGLLPPPSDTAYKEIRCDRLDGDTFESLQNGMTYWFRVIACYTIDGTTFESPAEYINAVPMKPAAPLEHFAISLRGDHYTATWSRSEWDVILFWSEKEPDYSLGAVYGIQELREKYRQLDLMVKNQTSAEFRTDLPGECYIIPGVIHATNVVLNKAVYVANVQPVKNVIYSFTHSEAEMYVEFDWPGQADHALLLYRTDDYPSGKDDEKAQKIETSRTQYENNCGMLVPQPPKGRIYAAVYAFMEGTNGRIFSEGVQILISNEPQREVLCSFRYKKTGLFSKKSSLTLEIQSEGKFLFPGFVIETKYGALPLKRGDGVQIAAVQRETEINGSSVFEFDHIQELRKGTRIRLFFTDDAHYKKYKLQYDGSNAV